MSQIITFKTNRISSNLNKISLELNPEGLDSTVVIIISISAGILGLFIIGFLVYYFLFKKPNSEKDEKSEKTIKNEDKTSSISRKSKQQIAPDYNISEEIQKDIEKHRRVMFEKEKARYFASVSHRSDCEINNPNNEENASFKEEASKKEYASVRESVQKNIQISHKEQVSHKDRGSNYFKETKSHASEAIQPKGAHRASKAEIYNKLEPPMSKPSLVPKSTYTSMASVDPRVVVEIWEKQANRAMDDFSKGLKAVMEEAEENDKEDIIGNNSKIKGNTGITMKPTVTKTIDLNSSFKEKVLNYSVSRRSEPGEELYERDSSMINKEENSLEKVYSEKQNDLNNKRLSIKQIVFDE